MDTYIDKDGIKRTLAMDTYLPQGVIINRDGTWRFSSPTEPANMETTLNAYVLSLEQQVAHYQSILED